MVELIKPLWEYTVDWLLTSYTITYGITSLWVLLGMVAGYIIKNSRKRK